MIIFYFTVLNSRTGRDRTNSSRDFFKYDKINNKNICNICDTTMIGNHAANLERHLKRFHNEEFENVQRKKIKLNKNDEPMPSTSGLQISPKGPLDKFVKSDFLKVKLNKEKILEACVELITVNGSSFEMLEYSGFKKILNPIVAAIDKNFSINSENVKLLIPETASKIVTKIRTALEKRIFPLKVDIATRLDKSILGINAQLIIDGKINLFTLAMTELKDKHTGIYIKNMVRRVLKKFNVDMQQMYSVTTDNGANMIKFVDLLGTEIEDGDLATEVENESHHFEEVFSEDNLEFTNITGIKCAAHTLQLAIKDSIKKADLNNFISDARELVKKLRIPSLISKFKDSNVKRPVLDCTTRWNSTYNMLKTLLQCKNLCSILAENNLEYYLPENKWIDVNLIVDTLQPLTEATLKLQSEQLTLSDFFGIWLESKIKIQNLKNFFADILYEQLCKRETVLLQNECVLGAVYLDPRFQILLSSSQKIEAVQHLKRIWNRLENFGMKAITNKQQPPSETENDEAIDDLEIMLRKKELAVESERTVISTDINIEY